MQSKSKTYTVGADVEHALALVKRGADELLVESEFAQKLARSEATGTPLRCKLVWMQPRRTFTSDIPSCLTSYDSCRTSATP